jgi:hypothetical protein
MLTPSLHHLAALALATPLLVAGFGCASSDDVDPNGVGSSDGGSGNNEIQEEGSGICLLHNCSDDSHCGACDQGRTKCDVAEGRCVACDAATATGCPEGQYCTSWGNCAADGLECATDAHGEPQISCAANTDCAACDPMHQVCDPATNTCVACTDQDTSECASDDICINNKCEDKCPSTCESDNDCGACGTGANAAHACHAHKCAECSATYACPAGFTCSSHGTCERECGDHDTGSCMTDADCAGCGASGLVCHVPLNGGAGTCGPAASGCSDLGQGALTLPAPFNQVTNTCSNDGDCAGVGVTLNVGEMLRDLTGIDGIDDANISYPMGECASVTISNNLSCGVCVPCEVDNDCNDIDVDQVALDAFGPIGSIAAAFLLDQVFGSGDHKIHMYCENVAGNYGVCVPCPGFMYDCSVGGGGGGGGGGSCSHDICSSGGPLNASCDSCSETVCDIDPYCCDTEWDSLCVGEAEYYCDLDCSGGGGGGACVHSECDEGVGLNQNCSSCADTVCSTDPYCCDNDWDDVCVQQAEDWCGLSCGTGGGGSCHDECDEGAALFSGCSSCAATVCNEDSFCCSTEWDDVCVDEAEYYCGKSCGGGGSSCTHDECVSGAALANGCSSCVSTVCGIDSYCCSTSWDSTCVGEAEDYCGLFCG